MFLLQRITIPIVPRRTAACFFSKFALCFRKIKLEYIKDEIRLPQKTVNTLKFTELHENSEEFAEWYEKLGGVSHLFYPPL